MQVHLESERKDETDDRVRAQRLAFGGTHVQHQRPGHERDREYVSADRVAELEHEQRRRERERREPGGGTEEPPGEHGDASHRDQAGEKGHEPQSQQVRPEQVVRQHVQEHDVPGAAHVRDGRIAEDVGIETETVRRRGRRARVVRLVPIEDVVCPEGDGPARNQGQRRETHAEQPEQQRRVTLEPPRDAIWSQGGEYISVSRRVSSSSQARRRCRSRWSQRSGWAGGCRTSCRRSPRRRSLSTTRAWRRRRTARADGRSR